MAKITITLDDTLQDRIYSAVKDVKQALHEYLEENHPDELPCLSNDLDHDGTIHEIIDSAVPIYTREIETAWFLHGKDLEAAYMSSGVGDNPRDNDGMAAIYYYLSDAVNAWYWNNAETIFDAWLEAQEKES